MQSCKIATKTVVYLLVRMQCTLNPGNPGRYRLFFHKSKIRRLFTCLCRIRMRVHFGPIWCL